MDGEPAEACLLFLRLPLQHRLIEPHRVLIIVIAAVQSHAQDLSSTVHRPNPPHRHPGAQAIEVSAGQEVRPQQVVGRGAAGGYVDASGLAAAALGVVVLPGGALEEVQHSEDPLLSIGLMEEEGDGQRRVA